MDVVDKLDRLNDRLKAASVGVAVEMQGSGGDNRPLKRSRPDERGDAEGRSHV